MPNEIQESNEDVVARYERGDIQMDALTEDQMGLALQRQYSQSETPSEQPKAEPLPEQLVETGKTQAELATEVDPQHKKIMELQVQLNQANQKERTATDRYDTLKNTQPVEPKKVYEYDKDRDMLDDTYLGQIDIQRQEIEELKKINYDRLEKDRVDAETREANKANDALFSDIGRMQDEFPSLKTSLPFQEVNTKYNDWYSKMNNSGKDIDKYLTDATYRQAVDATGLAPDLQLADISKAQSIYSGVEKMNNDLKAGYKSDFARAFKETDGYQSAYNSKYRGPELANEQALNDRVNEINSQATIMIPNETIGSGDTEQSLMDEMKSPNLTDERFEEINQLLIARINQEKKQG